VSMMGKAFRDWKMQSGTSESDEALVTAARGGDRDAFGLLVERYQDLVCAIAYSRIGNLEAAHDVAQDVFLASFEKLRLLTSPSKYRAWLARITRRLCCNWHRSEGYRQALVRGLRELGRSERAATPGDVLVEREDKAIVQRAVERLPESLRDVLILHYFEGRSHAETARDLGISRAAVDKRVERAKVRLRKYLTAKVEADLRDVQPKGEFTKRTLAAIPAGSICGKLGLDVARTGVAETLRGNAQAIAQRASTILTGGGTILTAKKFIVAVTVLVLLVAGGASYMAIRTRRAGTGEGIYESGTSTPPGDPVEGRAGQASEETSSGTAGKFPAPLSVEQINDLILNGSPELDAMEEGARLDTIRHLLRDALERTMSLELIDDEFRFAAELRGMEKNREALAVYRAIYEVASSPDNMSRALCDAALVSAMNGNPQGYLSIYMGNAARRIRKLYKELGQEDKAAEWVSNVVHDADELIPSVASGVDGVILMGIRKTWEKFEDTTSGRQEKPEDTFYRVEKMEDSIARAEKMMDYLRQYLLRDNLTPHDRWGSSLALAILLSDLGRHNEALEMWQWMETEAEVLGYPREAVWLVGERIREGPFGPAAEKLAGFEKARINSAKAQMRSLSLALFEYANGHEGDFPARIEDLVEEGFVKDASLLEDPLTGQPFHYTPGLNLESSTGSEILRSEPSKGLTISVQVGSYEPVVKMEE